MLILQQNTQVFAVSAQSRKSMPSILAEAAHCGRTIVTNVAWKCAVSSNMYLQWHGAISIEES